LTVTKKAGDVVVRFERWWMIVERVAQEMAKV
jgi:hypothetical protein